jgi:hypothetical protein
LNTQSGSLLEIQIDSHDPDSTDAWNMLDCLRLARRGRNKMCELFALSSSFSACKTRSLLPVNWGGRLQIIRDYASELKDRGIFNFLYCDGEYLFVHSHKRTQTDGEVKPPGLYVLTRQGHHGVATGARKRIVSLLVFNSNKIGRGGGIG